MTTCIHDLRKFSKPLYTLNALLGPVPNVLYSPDARYLAVMEADDYLKIYDVATNYKQYQVIDVFGNTILSLFLSLVLTGALFT